jgi:cell division septation protein DedD
MHAENEREFELVLGNKQLLGLLFVTFVLLGVFFALGYAMGRSSAPSLVVDSGRTTSTPTASNATPKPTAAEGSVPTQPMPTQQPAPTEATPAPAQSAAATQPEPTPGVAVMDPKPGDTFLQVTAVKRPEAELLVEVLTRKGFKAGLAPAPVENMFRVLVGPVHTDAEQGKLKSDLEQAGFKPIPRRY